MSRLLYRLSYATLCYGDPLYRKTPVLSSLRAGPERDFLPIRP